MPSHPVSYVPAKAGDVFKLGKITVQIVEDGSGTGSYNRLGAAPFTLPAQTSGPPPHYHEMHDETFLVTSGFPLPDKAAVQDRTIDTASRDYVVVPARAQNTFSNPFDEEASNSFMLAFYINHFKLIQSYLDEGLPMNAATNKKAMASYATLLVQSDSGK